MEQIFVKRVTDFVIYVKIAKEFAFCIVFFRAVCYTINEGGKTAEGGVCSDTYARTRRIYILRTKRYIERCIAAFAKGLPKYAGIPRAWGFLTTLRFCR